MDLLKSLRISSFEEIASLEKSAYDGDGDDYYEDEDYWDSNIVDDALEGDPDNYWNID